MPLSLSLLSSLLDYSSFLFVVILHQKEDSSLTPYQRTSGIALLDWNPSGRKVAEPSSWIRSDPGVVWVSIWGSKGLCLFSSAFSEENFLSLQKFRVGMCFADAVHPMFMRMSVH